MTYRARIDLGVAAVVVAIGAVFGIEAWRIDPRSYEAVGPRFVPVFLAGTMIVLGMALGLAAFLSRNDSLADNDPAFGFRNSDLRRVLTVIGAGAVYTFAFWALGYMAATVIGAALALWVFGVRSPFVLILVSIGAGVVYQAVFMGMMGLLDPQGALIDLRALSNLVTPG